MESFIYSYADLPNSIYANEVMTDSLKEFCQENCLHEKIADCIVSSMCIISNKERIVLGDRKILDSYIRLLYALLLITGIEVREIKKIIEKIESKNLAIFNGKETSNTIIGLLEKNENKVNILMGSKNITEIVNLFDMCYNGDDHWTKNKKIANSKYRNYFKNLYELELLAIKTKKESEKIRVRR